MEKKLSILILLPFVPFPPDDGGKIASYTFIENLRGRHDFTVLMPAYNKEQFNRIEAQRKLWSDVKLVSAQYAIHGFRNKLFSFARKLYPFIRRLATFESHVFNNHNMLYPFLSCNMAYFDAVRRLLAENKYDLIQVEYVQNLSLVDLFPKDIKKVYVEVESRYSLLNDYVLLGPLEKSHYYKHITENVKTVEAAFLSKYDAIIAYSNDDKNRLQGLLLGKPIYRSPLNLIKDSLIDVSFNDFSIEKIVFVGPEGHPPNKDAVIWFIEDIYPHLSKYNKKFYIIGKWSKEFARKYRHNKNIIFTGYIDDINSFIKNSLNVVPIRLGGGGLRIKILLSMSNGTPVISTPKACHGFDFTRGKEVIVAETSSEFVKEISDLLVNPEKAQNLAQNALLFYMNNYSVALTTEIRNNIYHQIVECHGECSTNLRGRICYDRRASNARSGAEK
jgi:glycosyltransferase involved in cell wall biosynthesis